MSSYVLGRDLGFQFRQHAVGDLDVQCARDEDVRVEQGGVRESVEVRHHSFKLVVQQDGLAQEEDSSGDAEEDLERSFHEPNVPHVADRGRWHGGKVQEEGLEPPESEQSHVQLVMLEVVRQHRQLDLDQPFEDAAADLQTAQLGPVHVSEVVRREEGVHDAEHGLLEHHVLVDFRLDDLHGIGAGDFWQEVRNARGASHHPWHRPLNALPLHRVLQDPQQVRHDVIHALAVPDIAMLSRHRMQDQTKLLFHSVLHLLGESVAAQRQIFRRRQPQRRGSHNAVIPWHPR
mmetsp:Transcript_11565/g.33267  ORF Transcript_11565/g.33267 Transcript_11565/m.33267 type:complete len:289 (-) Transcript_11565:2933-3799(-)